jgi:hypothetical protein
VSNLDILATLNPIACAGAQRLIAKGAILTSGRRTVDAQASADAADVVLDRQFIAKVYRKPLCNVAAALRACADQFPSADQAELTARFLGVMAAFDDQELEKLSEHLGGNAFDIHPDPSLIPACEDEVTQCVKSGGTALFLQKEGDLLRFHLQMK